MRKIHSFPYCQQTPDNGMYLSPASSRRAIIISRPGDRHPPESLIGISRITHIIQENGQVTLPIEFRRRYNLNKGDAVVFRETEEGMLISPKEALVMKLLDEIGEGLAARGITLDELISSGQASRQEIYDEQYGSGADD